MNGTNGICFICDVELGENPSVLRVALVFSRKHLDK
jgi:hypothetical protein